MNLLGVFIIRLAQEFLPAEKIMQVAAEGSDLHCFLCRLFTAHCSTKMWGLFPLREPISSFFRAHLFSAVSHFSPFFFIFTFHTIRQVSLPFLLLLGSHLFYLPESCPGKYTCLNLAYNLTGKTVYILYINLPASPGAYTYLI